MVDSNAVVKLEISTPKGHRPVKLAFTSVTDFHTWNVLRKLPAQRVSPAAAKAQDEVMPRQLEPALPAGADPRRHARLLARAHAQAMEGGQLAVRSVIGQSWQRMLGQRLNPDRGRDPVPLAGDEIDHRRRRSPLARVLPVLRDGLTSVADDTATIMVVVDADGRLLWREGSARVRITADDLGFVEGACWSEETVGTNAIGTALVTKRPLQVYSAEHFVRTHHTWTCSAAPIHDPRDGRLLGIVDLSGPARTVHPSTLALVDAVARLAQAQLRDDHLLDLERLRVVAAPTLTRVDGPALVTDPHGWVAAAAGLPPVDRVMLPEPAAEGAGWLPAFGSCQLEALPGGWLIRPATTGSAPATTAVIDVANPRYATLTVSGESGSWTHRLSHRHAEILRILAVHRDGRSASELSSDLFGDPSRTVTVRAEMSRLRRHLGGVLSHRPYRFAEHVTVDLRR
ncbi:GAF domain-containing protein [Fodinicola acaciae]|uniref:GAF domain-containing protein n=1 Tax=Fodinicola acaciae TaxID=2681555 RepID=UPI001FE7212E|nr:GAF domain-containing protein [Fodinicola acaciae]